MKELNNNKIAMEFINGVIKAEAYLDYYLLKTDGSEIRLPKKPMYYPSKSFIKAVESKEFKCSVSLLNAEGYRVRA